MLGTVRFVLASLVVANHLWVPVANRVGAHAVIAFYVISGFLMTKVLNEVYARPGGTVAYFKNRAVRLYSAYWLFLGLSLLGLIVVPSAFANVYGIMRLPSSAYDLFRNVTFWDLTNSPVIVVPPAWSLSVECAFYILMGLGLSRRREAVAIWFAISFAYTVYLIATGAPFATRYYPIPAASLFFSLGAVLYFYPKILEALRWRYGAVLLPLFCVLPLLADAVGLDRGMSGYYGSLLLFLPLFAWSLHQRSGRLDRFLGDLAYPIFLSHFFAAGLVLLLVGGGIVQYHGWYFVAGYGMTLAISLLYWSTMERWINKVRDDIRGGVAESKRTHLAEQQTPP